MRRAASAGHCSLRLQCLSKDAWTAMHRPSPRGLLLLRQDGRGEAGVALGELLLQLLVEAGNRAAAPLDHGAELLALCQHHAHPFDIDVNDLEIVVVLAHA